MRNWYLVMAKPRMDEVAEQNLTAQGFAVYRPQIQLQKTKRGKKVTIQESLFPRYLFIQLDSENENWAPIRSTKGVAQMVRFGSQLAKVNDRLIAEIKAREANTAQRIELSSQYQKGQPLRVEKGLFYGLEGVFDCFDADERVVLLMNLLGKQQELSLDPLEVQPV